LFGPTASVWGAGLSFAQPLFHGGALRAERKAAQAGYEASVAQYRQTVLNAFQNVADTLVALEQDAATLDASRTAADAARQSFEETRARRGLGAVSQPQALASEQRWQNARLNLIRSTATRMIDTATLFQAMGEKIVPGTGESATASVRAP
jgi:outer membrane protein TolC